MLNSSDASVLEARLQSLVDDRLFKAYWDAVAYFKTTDLVLCFDESVEVDPVAVYVREKLLTATDVLETLRPKITRPASDVAGQFASTDAAFWFVSIFADGEMAYAAIRAKYIGLGGNA